MADNRDDFIIAIRYALLKKGAKQKFSLFFLILLSISIITLDKLSFPFISASRSVLNDVVYHVSVASAQPEKLIKFFISKSREHFTVIEKNKSLNKEIDFLKKQKFNNAYLSSENEVLQKALYLFETKKFEQDFSIPAKIILDQESPFIKSLLINKGTNRGITKGMTVFNNDFLMGTIIETNYLTSRVLLLTDLNSKVPVIIEGDSANAILEGTGESKNLNLSYLPEEYELQPNKTIFTSGKDGFLVPGIPVAITYLNKKDKVLIKLLGDPDQALIVNVTKGQIN